MITVISPDSFKKIPWKNGLGFTTELAINDGASLDNFDWRLSIASVTSNGEFSNFSGYDRNLVLIEGNSISLQHDQKHTDNLTKLLDIAKFDGACKTVGTLNDGAIKDFNVITKQSTTSVQVDTYVAQQDVIQELKNAAMIFVYSLSANVTITIAGNEKILRQGHLAKINNINHDSNIGGLTTAIISGQQMIIAGINFNAI